MEIKAQITKKLQKYKADEIKTLYQLMLRVLSGNDDFRMVQNADTDDLRPVIEGETGEKIDFAMESIISGESLKLWQDIQAEEAEKVKLKKADRIERIASVMSDAALFEGFCLAFYGKDEMLAVLCDEYGCLEAYEALVQDTVYRKRSKVGGAFAGPPVYSEESGKSVGDNGGESGEASGSPLQ